MKSERVVMAADADSLETRVYTRIETVQACRIDGPFVLRGRGGDTFCEDGYVVIDATGAVCAMGRELFERTYPKAQTRRA